MIVKRLGGPGLMLRAGLALLKFFGVDAPRVVPPRRPSRLPSAVPPSPKPSTAARRPPVTPQKVTEWRKARYKAERVTSLKKRAAWYLRRANCPTTRCSAEFIRSAERLLSAAA